MHLYLSSNTPWNASYCLPEGQVIYKVQETGSTFGPCYFKILRVAPPPLFDPFADEVEDEVLQDRFDKIGEVEYSYFRASLVKFGNKVESIKTFFRKSGAGKAALLEYVGSAVHRVYKLLIQPIVIVLLLEQTGENTGGG